MMTHLLSTMNLLLSLKEWKFHLLVMLRVIWQILLHEVHTFAARTYFLFNFAFPRLLILSLSLSLSLSLCLYLYVSISMSLPLSLTLSLYVSLFISLSLTHIQKQVSSHILRTYFLIVGENGDNSSCTDGVPSTVEEDRRHLVEASIVRVMKARKRLSHNDLVAEISRQLSYRFIPSPQVCLPHL